MSLFELPSPFPDEPGLVRLLEPADSDAARLAAALLDGSYDKPFVLENGGLRALHFDLGYVQSVMRMDAPAALEMGYAQRMMAFLLFNPRPRKLLMIGLGGGSLVSFCHRHLIATALTVVEIDPHVLALRTLFGVPPDDDRLEVVAGDGAAYVANTERRFDTLMIDAFGPTGVADELLERDFYNNARKCLSAKGILIMNIAGAKAVYAPHVARLAEAFDDQLVAVSIRADGNYVLFAFNEAGFQPRWRWIHGLAPALELRLGLPYRELARELERGQVLRLAQRLRT